jgi:hypothetical protein
MSDLFNTVFALDPGVADRWKKRTKDDPNQKLTAADIDAIVGPLLSNKNKISEGQGNAIVELMQSPRFTKQAFDRLKKYYAEARKDVRSHFDVQILKGDALKPVYAALGHATIGKIMFKSPGTNISYSPGDYRAVADVIRDELIDVYEIRIGELMRMDNEVAFFVSGAENLFVYKRRTPREMALSIVHEATHVIQEKRSSGDLIQFLEADAFLAQAITLLTFNSGNPLHLGPIVDAAQIAASWVYWQHQMTDKNQKHWQDNYQDIVTAVAEVYPDATQRDNGLRSSAANNKYFNDYAKLDGVLEAINRKVDDAREMIKSVLP